MIRVYIVADQAASRARLQALVAHDPEIEVVGASGAGNELAHLLAKIAPDAVLIAEPGENDARAPAVLAGGDAADLTGRERQVLQLMAQGLPNKQIAAKLSISLHTVKFHVGSILAKLGASSRTEAVTLGARQGHVVL